MRCLAGMIMIGARTFNTPVQPGFEGFVLQNSFRQRTPANIAQTNHQDFHGANIARRFRLWICERVASHFQTQHHDK